MAVQWGLAQPQGGGFDYLESLQALGNAAAQRQTTQQRAYAFDQQRQQDQARPGIQQRAAAGDFAGAQAEAFRLGDYDAMKVVGGLEASKHDQLAKEVDTIGRLATSMIGVPADQRAQVFATLAPQLRQAGFDENELANVQLTDEALQQYIALATDTKTALANYAVSQKPTVLADGSQLYQGGKMIAENGRDARWQFDPESGSWLQEPGTGGGSVQQPGYAPRQAPMPAMGGGGPMSAMAAITAQSESGNRDYMPNGQLVTSPKGAQGAMQTMPMTQRDPGFGVAPVRDGSVEEKNRVGREYLEAMTQRYGDPAKAWAAYNAGPGRVDAAIARAGDNWLSAMPSETQNYVAKNTRQLQGGRGAEAPADRPGVVNVRAPRQKQDNAPAGYRWKADGSGQEAIPGGPADPKTATNRNVQSNRKAEADYRKEFDALPEVKTFKTARQQFNTLRDIGLKKNPTPQDDIALVYSYMKTLDPGSVVREGEFATAQNAGSLDDSIRNMYNKVLQGTRLNPQQRKSMVRTAYTNYSNYREAYNQAAENYRGYAKDNGISPDRVARTYQPDKPRASSQPKKVGRFTIVKVD